MTREAEMSDRQIQEAIAGHEELELLKARLFPPETSEERTKRALEALRQAIKPCTLDADSLRYIAQHADLEGS
jgi:hypothetical protein